MLSSWFLTLFWASIQTTWSLNCPRSLPVEVMVLLDATENMLGDGKKDIARAKLPEVWEDLNSTFRGFELGLATTGAKSTKSNKCFQLKTSLTHDALRFREACNQIQIIRGGGSEPNTLEAMGHVSGQVGGFSDPVDIKRNIIRVLVAITDSTAPFGLGSNDIQPDLIDCNTTKYASLLEISRIIQKSHIRPTVITFTEPIRKWWAEQLSDLDIISLLHNGDFEDINKTVKEAILQVACIQEDKIIAAGMPVSTPPTYHFHDYSKVEVAAAFVIISVLCAGLIVTGVVYTVRRRRRPATRIFEIHREPSREHEREYRTAQGE